jgi:ABC-type sugar transport system ATPase subunit
VRRYIRDIQRRLKVTTLYVTHDQAEAMTLGDRVVVMSEGRIQQVDAPEGIYHRPANTFVAGFVGSPPMNLLPARYDGGRLLIGDRSVIAPRALARCFDRCEVALTIGVRPEALTTEIGNATESLTVSVYAGTAESLGSETLVHGQIEGHEVVARLPGSPSPLPSELYAAVDRMHLFGTHGERISTDEG